MNIIEKSKRDRSLRIEELKNAIQDVKEAVLEMVQAIPTELIESNLNPETEKLFCSTYVPDLDYYTEKNQLCVINDNSEFIFGKYQYNNLAAERLNSVLAKYYSPVSCIYHYCIDLYSCKISFNFRYTAEFELEDFELDECTDKYGEQYYRASLKAEEKNMIWAFKNFFKDISEILQKDVEKEKWDYSTYGKIMHGIVFDTNISQMV